MARARVRAVVRKARLSEAHRIGQGVASIALDLESRTDLPLPVYVWAPLVYIAEMAAAARCRSEGWQGDAARARVAQYLMAGIAEFVVALFERFDVAHFEEWSAALERKGAASG